LHVDATMNSRMVPDAKKEPEAFKVYNEKIASLAESIKREGQLVPVNVIPSKRPGFEYELVAGFRRLTALKLLGKPTVLVKVDDVKSDVDRKIVNLAENVARDDLSSYELAVACRDLRDTYKLSANEITKRIGSYEGMSKSYINNIMRILEKCPPKVIAAWKDGHSQATEPKLLKIAAAKSKEEALELWDTYCGVNGEEEGDAEGEDTEGAEGGESGKKKARRATETHLLSALKAVRDAKPSMLGESQQEACIAVIEFALGRKKNLKVGSKVIYDAKAAKKAAKAEAQADKERQGAA
jgi:ParB/RepB/Spo0J family partition protein